MAIRRVCSAALIVAIASLSALVASSGARSAGAASSARQPVVSAPSTVHPGGLIRIDVSRFPANISVRVQFFVVHKHSCTCDVSALVPGAYRSGIALGSDGAGVLRVRMPRRYATCVCAHPKHKLFRKGQPVRVAVQATVDIADAYGTDRSRVR